MSVEGTRVRIKVMVTLPMSISGARVETFCDVEDEADDAEIEEAVQQAAYEQVEYWWERSA